MQRRQTPSTRGPDDMHALADLPPPDLAPYGPEPIRFAIAAWPLRAAEELRSALIFRALARASDRAGLPAPWPSRFRDAVRDELRHAGLCATVGDRLGAAPPLYDPRPVRARLAALPEPLFRAAALLVVEVAIGETISTSLLRAGRRGAIEPLSRALLTAILSDEVQHRELGWSAAAAIVPRLSAAQAAALQREVTAAFAAFEQQDAAPAFRWLQRGDPFDPAWAALGVLPPSARVEAFYSAVEDHVVPKLAKLGIDGARAWKERYQAQHA